MQLFLVIGLLFSSVGGLVVAAILKKLDNVVKEYSYCTANMFTAILSSFLFPDKFSITVFINLFQMDATVNLCSNLSILTCLRISNNIIFRI